MRQRHDFVPDARFELHELVDHCQGLGKFGYFRIPFSLHLLHYFLEMGMSSIDLPLNNVRTFFEIGSDITHDITPVFTVGLRQRIADRALVAVLWPLRGKRSRFFLLGVETCRTFMAFPLPELPRIIFGSKIKLCPAFIRKGSTQKTFI